MAVGRYQARYMTVRINDVEVMREIDHVEKDVMRRAIPKLSAGEVCLWSIGDSIPDIVKVQQ